MNQVCDLDNFNIVKVCTNIDQLTELANSSLNNSNDRMAFFCCYPSGDFLIYHITCELLNKNVNVDPLSDHTFYYKLDDKIFYQVTCRVISHSLIARKFGWVDLDPTLDIGFKNAIIQISNASIFFVLKLSR